MTLEELEYYRKTVHRLRRAREMKQRLLSAAYPGGTGADGGRSAVSDKTGKIGSELGDLDSAIEELSALAGAQRKKVEKMIMRCGDVWKRQLIRMRYHRSMEWQEIADLIGGGNNAGSVRAMVMREVEKLVQNGAGAGKNGAGAGKNGTKRREHGGKKA